MKYIIYIIYLKYLYCAFKGEKSLEDAKKLPISVRYGDVKSRKKEFLVPHPNEDGTLVGIETGKVYNRKWSYL